MPDSVELAKRLGPLGVDLIDCSSGGAVLEQQIPIHPGYQVPLAQAVREGAEIKSAAVGLISEPVQAEEILANERADLIVIGRMALWSPYWPHHAASALHAEGRLPDPIRSIWDLFLLNSRAKKLLSYKLADYIALGTPGQALTVDEGGFPQTSFTWVTTNSIHLLRFGADHGSPTLANIDRSGLAAVQIVTDEGQPYLIKGVAAIAKSRIESAPFAMALAEMENLRGA